MGSGADKIGRGVHSLDVDGQLHDPKRIAGCGPPYISHKLPLFATAKRPSSTYPFLVT